jgi:hypothetical protein
VESLEFLERTAGVQQRAALMPRVLVVQERGQFIGLPVVRSRVVGALESVVFADEESAS